MSNYPSVNTPSVTPEFTAINTEPVLHTLIVAAGRGQRFGGAVAKQYTQVAGQTVLQHSVANLAKSNSVNSVYIVVASDDQYIKKLTFATPIHLAIGGSERWQSVQAGVDAIAQSGANADDLVMIHDAARPCIDSDNVDKVLQVAMNERYGAILGTPVSDTLKQVIDNDDALVDTARSVATNNHIKTIGKTINRANLWQAQTPQVFRLGKLIEVLNFVNDNRLFITDEASAFEALGYPIKIVEGNRLNLKLTYPHDLPLLNAILNMH